MNTSTTDKTTISDTAMNLLQGLVTHIKQTGHNEFKVSNIGISLIECAVCSDQVAIDAGAARIERFGT